MFDFGFIQTTWLRKAVRWGLGILLAYYSAVGVYSFFPALDLNTKLSFISLISTVSITAFGFVLVFLSILASVQSHNFVKVLGESGHYRTLIKRTVFSGLFFLLGLIFSISAMLTEDDWLAAMSVSLIAFALYITVMILDWMYFIFDELNPSSDEKN